MKTELVILSDANQADALAHAGEILRGGGLVAFPTETVYGLGANALDPRAVARIFTAKQRALSDPLIVHVASAELAGVARAAPLAAAQLMRRFWPGPLTLVLQRDERIPRIVTAGGDTVGVRMPDHRVALGLIEQAGTPIAAPSANLFGHVSPTHAEHVLADLDGRIELVLDGGACRVGLESTVLDLTSAQARVLRPGKVTLEELERELGTRVASGARATSADEVLRAPGMLEKHYAPRAELVIARSHSELFERARERAARATSFGLLLREADLRAVRVELPEAPFFSLGAELDDAARRLYAGLRALDDAAVHSILTLAVEPTGLGAAIADRLRRAAAR